jgi:hypothetical protein
MSEPGDTAVDRAAHMIEELLAEHQSPVIIAKALSATGLLWEEDEATFVLDPILRVLPAECWITRTALARCTDLIGAPFATGATWSEEMCCVPCRVRFAVYQIRERARDD